MNTTKGLYYSQMNKSKVCGYCRFHKCHVSVRQLKEKNCLSKGCHYLVKYEHPWWDQREREKTKKKLNRQIDKLLF